MDKWLPSTLPLFGKVFVNYGPHIDGRDNSYVYRIYCWNFFKPSEVRSRHLSGTGFYMTVKASNCGETQIKYLEHGILTMMGMLKQWRLLRPEYTNEIEKAAVIVPLSRLRN